MKKIIIAIALGATTSLFALGTQSGTDITNSATLTYSAGGVDQPDVTSNTDTFKVDKKVDMLLATNETDQVHVHPGEHDRITTYIFKNEGNAEQKFTFAAKNLTTADANNGEADYNSKVDDQETDGALTIEYSTDGGTTWTAYNSAISVGKDTEVKFRVKANIKSANDGAVNGNIMNIQLEATAVKDDGTTVEEESTTEDATIVDVVLADGIAVQNGATTVGGQLGDSSNGKGDNPKDGKEAARSGYIIQTPVLSLNKTSCVISDPVNGDGKAAGTYTPKRIPGAVIRYMLDIKNTGSADANDTTITDDLVSDLDYDTLETPNDNVHTDIGDTACDCSSPRDGTASTVNNAGNNPQVKLEGINVAKPAAGKSENHTCAYFEVEVK